jgi:transposase InsO family protein
VRGVGSRHDLLSQPDRRLRLEQAHRETALERSDPQVRLLERFSPKFRERRVEVHSTGAIVAVDPFFVGTLQGVGKAYLQTVLDCYRRVARGRLYPRQPPVTAAPGLNEAVLPFCEAHHAASATARSDHGREVCGRPDQHPSELFLQLEGMTHPTPRVRRPQSNGFRERLPPTLLDEPFRVKGRTPGYETVDPMPGDLEQDLHPYHSERPHPGRRRDGRTPYTRFTEGLSKRPVISDSDAA